MYVLTLNLKRAETVDTLLLLCSDNYCDLEELILSLWEEQYYVSFYQSKSMQKAKEYAYAYANELHITFVPYYK